MFAEKEVTIFDLTSQLFEFFVDSAIYCIFTCSFIASMLIRFPSLKTFILNCPSRFISAVTGEPSAKENASIVRTPSSVIVLADKWKCRRPSSAACFMS